MKLISWNVNGLRACMQKGFLDQFNRLDADFFCLQETKLQPGQLDLDLPGYEQYWNYAEKKGYSGTAIFTKFTPMSVQYGIGIPEFDTEGRVITLEYPEFFLVTCYTPNAQRGLARLGYRMNWDEAFRGFLQSLDEKKPVILCGDLNVAHQEIDLKNPKSNRGSAGFSDEERESFTKTLSLGFTDSFRHLHPDTTGVYSWWSYMYHARENNAGWRIDYFVVSDRLKDAIVKTPIHTDIMGSDHCPVGLEIDLLCNGSLWAPSSHEKAVDRTPPKEPASPVVKTVLTCLLLTVLLVGGIFTGIRLFPRETAPTETNSSGKLSPPEPRYITLHAYETPLYYENSIGQNYDHRDIGEGYLFSTEEAFLLTPTAESAYVGIREANFWLRLELTEIGLSVFDRDVFPSFRVTNGSVDNLSIFLYRTPSSKQFAGWFITGTATEPVTLNISCGIEEYEATLIPQEITAPEYYTVQVNNAPDLTQLLTYPGSYHPDIYTENDLSYYLGTPIYDNLWDANSNFAVTVTLTPLGKACGNIFTFDTLLISAQSSSTKTALQPFSLSENSDSVDGFLYYGHASAYVSIYSAYFSQKTIFPVSPESAEDSLLISAYTADSANCAYTYTGEFRDLLSVDGQVYQLGQDIQAGDRSTATQWVFLELTEAGRDNHTFYPFASVLIPPGSQDNGPPIGLCPYFGSPHMATSVMIQLGWVAYFQSSTDVDLVIQYDTDYRITVDGYPYLTWATEQ